MDILAQATTCRFDDFQLDLHARALFRLNDGSEPIPVSLGSRAFSILCVLIERQGEFVSKHEIMNAVWPDAAVEDSNLTVQMSALRRVLDVGRDSGSCIQTIRKPRLLFPAAGRPVRCLRRDTHEGPYRPALARSRGFRPSLRCSGEGECGLNQSNRAAAALAKIFWLDCRTKSSSHCLVRLACLAYIPSPHQNG